MKKVITMLMVVLLLTGCRDTGETQDQLLKLREQLQQRPCRFTAHIQSDFGKTVYEFSLDCQFDTAGNMTFSVISPESIAGITGTVSGTGGSLTFQETALGFPLLAEGELSPVSAPWLVIKGLRGGYLAAWGRQGQQLSLTVDDSFLGEDMQLRLTLDEDRSPLSAEILWEGRCILSVGVDGFQFL